MNETELKPEIDPHMYGPLTELPRQCSGERKVFLTGILEHLDEYKGKKKER